MRHKNKTVKLQRTASHRDALLSNLANSLIEHGRIRTTLAKAKALRPFAERLVTLGKRDSLHARRRAIALLGSSQLAQRSATKLFTDIAPASADRAGGYTRITRLGERASDSAQMAFLEWVDAWTPEEDDDDLDLD
jgi:large subunit ribosomal protein L17